VLDANLPQMGAEIRDRRRVRSKIGGGRM
jgi:hypothetical protein